MAGFANSVSNNINCVFASNADFSGNGQPSDLNGLQADGQLWIGSTALNAGGTHVNVGTISGGTGITVTPGSGTITISLTGGGAAVEHLTGDTGGLLNPSLNNFNVFGLSGSKTSGSGSTITVKSPPFSQIGSSATSSLNTGEFVTAAVTRTLPASAGLADGDLFIYVCTTASALVIQAVSAQKIRIGTLLSSAAGTATSTNTGDSVTLRFNATDGFFYAVSLIGTWLIA